MKPTMLTKFTFTILLIVFTCTTSTYAIQCGDMLHPKTQYFIDLTDYRNSSYNFDVLNSSYHTNNWVAFTGSVSLDGILYANSFVVNTSECIRQLDLDQQNLTTIMPGAFTSLYCLKQLNLSQNNITTITSSTFLGLTFNLEILDLSNNHIFNVNSNSRVDKLANSPFAALVGLKDLNLSGNFIRYINASTFTNNTRLLTLNLQNNWLRRINPVAMSAIPHLEKLSLDQNFLDDLQIKDWKNSTHLTFLNISRNFLHVIDVGTNSSLVKLTDLDVSSNQLFKLNATQIEEQLPKLERIFLDGNPWFCDTLDEVMANLSAKIDNFGFNKSTSARNGIACMDRFTPSTEAPLPTTQQASSSVVPLTSSTGVPSSTTTDSDHSGDNFSATASVLVSSIEQLQTTVTLLTIIVIIIVVAEVVFRTGLHRRLLSRRNGPGPIFDVNRTYNNESENMALIR